MHVKVLGPIEVHTDDGPVQIGASQRRLIAVLAARPGEVVAAGVLAEALWPDTMPSRPAGALHNVVSRLRGRLGAGATEALRTRPPGYGLALDQVSIDHLEFERSLAAARSTIDTKQAIDAYDEALATWRGDAYAEFADLDRVRDDAIRLDELRTVAREERLALLVLDDPARALPELEAVVASQPYRERGHMLLMEALYRNHRQRDALAAFERYRVVLAEELGLVPSGAMRRLEHAILTDSLPSPPSAAVPAVIADVPAPPSAEARAAGSPARPATGNVAERRTSFVGRAEQVADVADVLRGRRLVSLVGVGGAGKTALAIEVARRVADRYVDGTWVVDLVDLPPGGRIADHIAGALSLGRLPAEDVEDALAHRLAGLDALVVLDNCEHLVHEVAGVVDAVLAVRGRVRFLTTSREALRIPGEHVTPVLPLTLPPEGADRDQLLASASGRLFVDRVLDVDPSADLSDPDAALVAAICRRLDGLPLAIELAAARLPALGARSLSTRLDDRFRLLSSHHRTSVEHHQTLRAAIDWSVQLLDEPQRRLLRRLGVFVGDADLEAIEYVCADERLDATSIADTLTRLVDRSLVVRRRDGVDVRFRLLETVREYARSMPEEPGPSVYDSDDRLRRRHRSWYTRYAHEVGAGFLVATGEWYPRLRTAFPNLRAAFEWSMERGDVSDALDLATAMSWAPFNTGHLYREVQSWVERSLDAALRTAVDGRLLGRGLVAAASLATLESRPVEAIDLLEQADEIFTSRDDATVEAIWSKMWSAAAFADAGRHAEAVAASGTGLDLAIRSGEDVAVVYLAAQHAEVLVGAALLGGDAGATDAAVEAFDLAVETAHRIGAEEGLLRARHGRALLAAVTGDPRLVVDECCAAVEDWRRVGLGNRLIMGLVATARVAVLADRLDVAARLVVEALDVMDRVGWRQPTGRALEVAALVALAQRDLERAAMLVGAAEVRFATPRWFVPVDAAHERLVGRSGDPRAASKHVSIGRGLTDAAAGVVARQVAAALLDGQAG